MRKILPILLFALILLPLRTADANLIDGDFNSLPSITNLAFSGATGPFGQWLGNDSWSISPTGGPDGSAYASHSGNTTRLYQGFDASSNPLGTGTRISLDYIYQSGFTGPEEQVWVFGLTNTQGMSQFPPYNETTGTGYFGGVTPDILTQFSITIHPVWTHMEYFFPISGSYDAILVAIGYGAFGANTSGLRGVDNVSIPEPSTLLLLGSGLIGIVGFRKKFKK